MKKIIFILFLLCGFSAHTQTPQAAKTATLAYSLDTIRLDSFYLVEVYTAAPTAQAPRPNSETRYQFFADTAQVRLYMSNLQKDAESYYNQAILLATKAKGINDLISTNPWFSRKKPEKKPDVVVEKKLEKPAKKSKKKKQ